MKKEKPPPRNPREEILALHRQLIEAHLHNNAEYFDKGISPEFVSVSHGEIRRQTPDEVKANIRDYIENTAFTEYRDLTEPIVGFSDDGSAAWSIVRVKVVGRKNTGDPVDFTCAWLTLYRREGNGWSKLAEASTFP